MSMKIVINDAIIVQMEIAVYKTVQLDVHEIVMDDTIMVQMEITVYKTVN
jgi:hypothetical protein